MSGRPREFEREAALEKAMEVFWIRGYEGAGMSELVKHTGVAKQSLYNTFGNKRELFRAALRHYAWTRHRAILEVLNEPGSALVNIDRVLNMWQERARSANCDGCLIVNSIAEMGAEDPELASWLVEQIEALEKAFLHTLRRARREGEIDPEVELKSLSRLLVSTSHGLAVLGKLPLPQSFAGDVVKVVRSLLRVAHD